MSAVKRHFGIGFESTYGTIVAPTVWPELLRETIKTAPDFEEVTTIRCPAPIDVKRIRSGWSGDIEMLIDFQTYAHLMYWFFGSVTTAGAGPYTHTSPKTTGDGYEGREGVSASLEIRRAGAVGASSPGNVEKNWRYGGGKAVGMGLNWTVSELARATMSLIGSSENRATAPATPSPPTFQPVRPGEIDVQFDGTTLKARRFTLNKSIPTDDGYVLSNLSRDEPLEDGVIAINGEIDVWFRDFTEYAKFEADTDVDVTVDVQADGADPEAITYNMNKVRLKQATPTIETRGRMQATYQYESFFDTAQTINLQSVVVNDQATVP